MAAVKDIRVAEILNADADGIGHIAIKFKRADGKDVSLVLDDKKLEVLIAFLTAIYSESLSKQAAETRPIPFAIAGFQVGDIGGSPTLRVDTMDGLPFYFSIYPGGNVEKIKHLCHELWSEITGAPGSMVDAPKPH